MARVRKPSAFGLHCLGRGFLYVDSSFHHPPTYLKTSAKIKQSDRIFDCEATFPLQSSISSNNFCQLEQNREPDVIPSSRTTNVNTNQSHKKLSAQQPMISKRSRLVPIFSSQCTIVILLITLLHSLITTVFSNPQEAEHLTALVGDSIVFNCHIEFPESHTVPYVIQWEKKGVEIPIFIWYENYLHTGDGYEGRVSRVVQQNSNLGLASLNLTRIRESDQGWYLCLVNFLNRSPRQDKNGTLFHLNVHAPPRFTMTPDDIVYASLGDPIILSCLAEGTPVPEILWHRGNELVHTSASLAVANDGTELRISSIRQEDIGDYTCVAKNGQGSIRHTTKLVVAGGAVIIVPPLNVTRLEGDKLEMPCEARGLPGNLSVTWFRESHAIRSIPWLESRTLFKKDGSLVISPVHSDDRGLYSCEVTNGIGEPQRASAYIEVEYPARVTFTPTVQYLPLSLSGVVRCHVEAHPPFQFITWTKDARIFDPFETPNVGVLKNGSLLFEKVTHDNQGRYRCTPYNVHGTAGPSTDMEVLVREPPNFVTRPKAVYQQKIDDDVQMACEAQGTPNPRITWRRADGKALPRDRSREDLGVLTLSKLRRTDFGFYECHVSNEVATLITTTHLVIEGTTPHSPYNITTESTEFSVNLEWLPGYSGGSEYSQKYVIWYRQEGASQWIPLDVDPPDSTKTVIDNLQPGTSYEFQVIGKNVLGDGMFSDVVKERTKDFHKYNVIVYPTDARGSTYIPVLFRPTGPPPIAPENVTLTETSDGVLLTWNYPRRSNVAIAYFTVDYCYDDQWKRLSKTQLKPHEVSFLVNNLNAGKTYVFRVNAHTLTSQASSEKLTYVMPRKTKNKAITAGVVGGILFFIVAIILAVCTVKCVNKRNKRRRREQEKAYSMVACQVTDTRNGNDPSPPAKSVPPRKGRTSRLPSLTEVRSLKNSLDSFLCHTFRFNSFQGNTQENTNNRSTRFDAVDVNLNSAAIEAADWLEYGAAEIKQRRSNRQITPFGNQTEILKQEGWMSRPPEKNSASTGIWQFHTIRKDEEYESPSQERSQSSHQYYQLTPASHQVESGFYNVRDRLLWPQTHPNPTKELSFPPDLHTSDLVFHPISNSNSLLSSASPHFISQQFGKHRLHPQTSVLASPHEVIRSSSPGSALLFTPTLANFSDMSSVQHPSSAEQSYAAPNLLSSHVFPATEKKMKMDNFNNFFPDSVALTSSVPNSRYIRELPSLLPLHQELAVHQSSKDDVSKSSLKMRTVRAEIHSIDTPRNSPSVQNEFSLLLNTAGRHFHAPPPFRSPPPPFISTISYPSSSQRPLATSSPPRSRHSQSDILSIPGRHLAGSRVESRRRRSPLTIAVRLSPARTQQRLSERNRNQIVEYSPQSQSSSSGFDSKNTSQQNQSTSHFGSGHYQYAATETQPQKRFESTYVNWPIKGVTPPSHLLLDASVDNHYEFDTTQSPTGQESSSVNATYFPGSIPSTITTRSSVLVTDSATANRNKKLPTQVRSENIEARVQAMKEEFQEYRKRRARGLLESAC